MGSMSEKRVVMAKRVATAWLGTQGSPEYRLTAYLNNRNHVPRILRAFRDGKTSIRDVDPIPDLGLRLSFDAVEAWSENREGITQLQSWLTKCGCEVSGGW